MKHCRMTVLVLELSAHVWWQMIEYNISWECSDHRNQLFLSPVCRAIVCPREENGQNYLNCVLISTLGNYYFSGVKDLLALTFQKWCNQWKYITVCSYHKDWCKKHSQGHRYGFFYCARGDSSVHWVAEKKPPWFCYTLQLFSSSSVYLHFGSKGLTTKVASKDNY